MQIAPDKFLNSWHLTLVRQVANTGQAQVWKVETADGQPAALKVYQRADRGNEEHGPHLMTLWQDRGAVGILAEAPNALLMEWLEGPSLGDLARAGQADTALEMLAQVAGRLHQPPHVAATGLKPLRQVFAPLFECKFAENCPTILKRDMTRAISIGHDLLDSQDRTVPLHGDLHPDNVIVTTSGTRVFDAKGYVGDPAFELANALRHPERMPRLVRQREQIEKCLSLYANAMGVDCARLAKWSAAKCALSIFWKSGGVISDDAEADLLSLLLHAADQ